MTLISSTRFFNGALLAGAMALISTESAVAQPAPGTADSSGRLVQTWDKTFPRSEKVDHQKVTFKNRYGITLAADVYLPKDRGNKKLAALVISGPFGAVKEQASGLYAQTLAERGFVTLAFDPSYTGESSGEPRNIASPDINTEDFMAAVDFIGLQPYVDRERIGVIGICGMGGIALNAVAVDKRVKAVVASTMAASGHRTQNSELFLEIEASDAVTGKPMIRVVRKAFGKTVSNSNTPITFDELKPGIDTMVRDTVSFNAP